MNNPYYINENIDDIEVFLQRFYSRSEIKQLKKEHGIQIAKNDRETWVKVGKQLFIGYKEYSEIAHNAGIYWEYHFQLKPKKLKWNKL